MSPCISYHHYYPCFEKGHGNESGGSGGKLSLSAYQECGGIVDLSEMRRSSHGEHQQGIL